MSLSLIDPNFRTHSLLLSEDLRYAKKQNLFLDTQNENSAIEVMLLRTQSPIKLSNKLCAGREHKEQNLAILYTTERSSFLFSSLHILSNVFVKRQH